MKFTMQFWKEDPTGKTSKRVLIAEETWDADVFVREEMSYEAGQMIEEAVRCNVETKV